MRFEIPQEMVDRLDKGSVLTLQQVKAVASPSDRGRDPKLLMMGFGAALKRAMRLAGKPCTVRVMDQGRSLHVLADSVASTYNAAWFRNYGRRQRRRFEEMGDVDTGKLDNEERQKHLHSHNVMGRVLAAADAARRTPELVPVVRNVPVIGRPENKEVSLA